MCGIGRQLAVPVCSLKAGTTSAPVTTSTPCKDRYRNCRELALTNCRGHGEHCPQVRFSDILSAIRPSNPNIHQSCGLCPGLTPHSSNFCYNTFTDCDEIAAWGLCQKYQTDCCISCGGQEEKEVTTTSTTTEGDCHDDDITSDCENILSAGLCSKIPNMHCDKTCGKC